MLLCEEPSFRWVVILKMEGKKNIGWGWGVLALRNLASDGILVILKMGEEKKYRGGVCLALRNLASDGMLC